MTVGLVIVSHSARIADGVVELAAQMAEGVRIAAAGGTPDGGIGTDFDRVRSALVGADSGDGVVVLCDLGSAVLTAETAVETAETPDRIRIADAPLVEGAVAAAVAARVGDDLDAVLRAAESAGRSPDAAMAGDGVVTGADGRGAAPAHAERRVTLRNETGLHARPAAEFVTTASRFSSAVTVDGVDARSLLAVMALGATRGREVTIAATGSDATAAVDALVALIDSGFGEN